jgi:hypothetical protein
MKQSVERYNETVLDEQTQHGRLPSSEDMGSRLERGAWRAYVQ